jgi:hypothetical protein
MAFLICISFPACVLGTAAMRPPSAVRAFFLLFFRLSYENPGSTIISRLFFITVISLGWKPGSA